MPEFLNRLKDAVEDTFNDGSTVNSITVEYGNSDNPKLIVQMSGKVNPVEIRGVLITKKPTYQYGLYDVAGGFEWRDCSKRDYEYLLNTDILTRRLEV